MAESALKTHTKNVLRSLNMLDLDIVEQAAVLGLSFQTVVDRLCMLNKPHGRAVISFMLSQMIAQAEKLNAKL